MATRHNRVTSLILIAAFALFVSTAAAAHAGVAVGINVGVAPPLAPSEVVVTSPGPGFVWVGGHYDWVGGRYVWSRGSWIRPPHARAVWVAPRFVEGPHGRMFYRGYWRR